MMLVRALFMKTTMYHFFTYCEGYLTKTFQMQNMETSIDKKTQNSNSGTVGGNIKVIP